MRRAALLLAFAALPAVCAGQAGDRVLKPEIRKGDSWTYRSTNIIANGAADYELKVEKSDDKAILVVATRKNDDKEFDATYTPEWNVVVGVSGMINSPPPAVFLFPMKAGDARAVEFTQSRPRADRPPTKFETRVEVAGWEEVTVPAGKFRAMKLVMDGVFFPPFSRGPSKTRMTFWYVPEVRRWVKLHLNRPGVDSEEELLEYKLNED